jgi:5-methyltetrahydrofolate--homocysteine methyltransferase
MEELCREMALRNMNTPLLIGGATTSAVHTAVKLAPLYSHVFYGADASEAAVLAKKCMMDRDSFENEQHAAQERIRNLYSRKEESEVDPEETAVQPVKAAGIGKPEDIIAKELVAEDVMPYFDWRMFYAIWGVKYGSAVPEAAEIMQLRLDAEDEIAAGDFKIMLSARFFSAYSSGGCIHADTDGKETVLPMMRQENGQRLSLCDFLAEGSSGTKSPLGVFAISVRKKSKEHTEGCCCPACSNRYEDMIGRTVRQTLAEAASRWLDRYLIESGNAKDSEGNPVRIIKPAAGYASCPDHTLKGDILRLLGECAEPHHCHEGHCHHHDESPLGIHLTESYAMTPEASICGMIFMHPDASYPQIRHISPQQYEEYARVRGMDEMTARRFLGHLL